MLNNRTNTIVNIHITYDSIFLNLRSNNGIDSIRYTADIPSTPGFSSIDDGNPERSGKILKKKIDQLLKTEPFYKRARRPIVYIAVPDDITVSEKNDAINILFELLQPRRLNIVAESLYAFIDCITEDRIVISKTRRCVTVKKYENGEITKTRYIDICGAGDIDALITKEIESCDTAREWKYIFITDDADYSGPFYSSERSEVIFKMQQINNEKDIYGVIKKLKNETTS